MLRLLARPEDCSRQPQPPAARCLLAGLSAPDLPNLGTWLRDARAGGARRSGLADAMLAAGGRPARQATPEAMASAAAGPGDGSTTPFWTLLEGHRLAAGLPHETLAERADVSAGGAGRQVRHSAD